MTGKFASQQMEVAISDNIRTLNNITSRIEYTEGDYFDNWQNDARMMIAQEPAFKFMEWIDHEMIIREVVPFEENHAALGLDIGNLDYRRPDWLATKRDSVTNITHWIELVQGRFAFLIDAPIYFKNNFYGTITAGLDFQEQFDDIMLGWEMYHVELEDEKGNVFYKFGQHEGTEEYMEYMYETSISVLDSEKQNWAFRIVPNDQFFSVQKLSSEKLNLILGLILCFSLSVVLFYMQKSLKAQKKYKSSSFKLRSLIDSSPVAIYVINPKGRVIDFWNTAAEEMLGWKKDEVMGKYLPHVFRGSEELFGQIMSDLGRGKQIKEMELTASRKDGSEIPVRLNVGHLISEGEENQMLVLLEDMSLQKEIQRKLKVSLSEKEVLLTEVHHRVKNNLAIITGLIELQIGEVEDILLRGMLKETQNRIYSIAGVHELLYDTTSFTNISLEEYVKKLLDRMRLMFEEEEVNVEILQELEVSSININQAIPLGLMLNELVSNSYKHAFKTIEEGCIRLVVYQADNIVSVQYSDNGEGFDLNEFNSSNAQGLMIIKTLLQQLKAAYEVDTTNGFELNFNFQMQKKGAHSNWKAEA
ncbi:MAG: PAS domain S-box protein [Balneolaceae bacterium]|nr:PAS domain S-box protein [Balneolaceae bacterium]